MQINKLILVPLLAAIADFVKQVTGYEFSNDNIDLATNVILGIITVIGVWMNRHKKKKTTEVADHAQYPDVSDAL